MANSGTADRFLKAYQVPKTARAHQMSAYALYKLGQDAYDKTQADVTFAIWSLNRKSTNVQTVGAS